MPTRSFIKRLLLAASCLALGVVGCLSTPNQVALFVTGDSRGYLEPCGCRRDQAGGLPGRATIVDRVRPEDRLVVDTGNLSAGSRDYEVLKTNYMEEGMAMIGYDAVNLGRKESELDLDRLEKLLASPLPFVCANVLEKSTRKRVTEPYRILNRCGLKIGVIGVSTSAYPEEWGPGIFVRPPVETLAEVIPELKPKCDYLVVLAFVDDDGLKEIANKFHEVDCVLGGDVPQSSSSVEPVNRAALFSVTDRGKVVGRIDLTKQNGSFAVASSKAIKVDIDKTTGEKRIDDLLGVYKNELRDRRYEFASVEDMERIDSGGTSDEFVGDQACISCHASAHNTWVASAHSHAFQTLVAKKSEYDPDCLRCHTVGYGLSTGFVDAVKTPTLENVQCESCHGRGKQHVATKSKASLKPVTPASCVRCHDQENSENFQYASFWAKIAH